MQKTIISEKISRELVEELSNQNNEPSWLKTFRLKAWDAYESLPKPNFVYGLGINLDPSVLDFEKLSLPHIEKLHIQNNPKIIVSNFSEALRTHEDLIKQHLLKNIDFSDKFSTLHASLFQRGIFVYIPKQVEATLSFDFPFISPSSFDHVLIVADRYSKVNFIENTFDTKLSKYNYRSSITEIVGKESSQINYSSVQHLSDVISFSKKTAVLEKDSSINWVVCDLGGSLCKSDVSTWLAGEGSGTKTMTFFFGSGKQQLDLTLNVHHQAPYTTSDLVTRGALNQHSKAIYRGLVKIHKNAPNSTGFQKEDTLLLSEHAEADAVPNLEIDNNNVKCSHGTTIGQIDHEKLFYLMSRSLDEEKAKRKIIEAFFDPLIRKIDVKDLRKNARQSISKKLNRGIGV